MVLRERDALAPAEIKKYYQDSWIKIRSLFPWTVEAEKPRKMAGEIKFQNGYRIEATYMPLDWVEVRVYKGDEGVLSFVMRDSGLESLGSRNPSLALGATEVKLGKLSISLQGELRALSYPIEQSDNMDILGVQLVEWLWSSVNVGELKPLDLSVKFPLLPQE